MAATMTPEFAFAPFTGGSIRLDRLDVRILVALQNDGRMTNLKLADIVGLSPTPCLQRVRRLESAGYIKTYEAVLDIARLVRHQFVFTQVTLASQKYEDAQRFERFVNTTPEILECFGIGSGYDYLVQSVARDIPHYQELVDALLSDLVGVKHVATFLSLKTVKRTRALPVSLLQGVTPV
jgi:Lrp/AsnC family transcriptional regulator, regulator of ectoine-degradation genes